MISSWPKHQRRSKPDRHFCKSPKSGRSNRQRRDGGGVQSDFQSTNEAIGHAVEQVRRTKNCRPSNRVPQSPLGKNLVPRTRRLHHAAGDKLSKPEKRNVRHPKNSLINEHTPDCTRSGSSITDGWHRCSAVVQWVALLFPVVSCCFIARNVRLTFWTLR